MKQIKKLLLVLLAMVSLSACETYGDYETEYTAIYPLCGEWVVSITGADGVLVTKGITCSTYNTTDNATDKMWIKMGTASNIFGIRGKINCNVPEKTFEGTNIVNLVNSTDGVTSETSFTMNGKVVLEGYTTQANTKADAIEFTLTTSKGDVMKVQGFRKTGWEGEDY